MNGVYLLAAELGKDTTLTIGKLGEIHFKKGCYVYVGSALNGLEQRITWHLRTQKKSHWHIDYFLQYSTVLNVFYKETTKTEECTIAHVFEKNFLFIPGFGCSDCRCTSHLFYGSSADIIRVAHSLGMKPYLLHTNP